MLLISQDQMEQLSEASLDKFRKRAAEHLRTIFPEKFDSESNTYQVAQTLVKDDVEDDELNVTELPTDELIEIGRKKAITFNIVRERQLMLFIDLLVTKGMDFPEPENYQWAKTILIDPELAEKAKLDLIFENLKARENPSHWLSPSSATVTVEERSHA